MGARCEVSLEVIILGLVLCIYPFFGRRKERR